MAFIQTMEFTTDNTDQMLALARKWHDDASGTGTAQGATLVEDDSTPGRYVMAVSFESAEAAAENSNRPETGAFADEFRSLCSDGPEYREFDLVTVFDA